MINLSVAAGVYESYNTDPLTLAAQARGRSGHRRRHRGRQLRPERRRAAAVRRHHVAGQRALGADRRRFQPQGHDHAQTTIEVAPSVRAARASSTTRPSPTGRAGCRDRIACRVRACSFATHPNARLWGTRRYRAAAISEPERHEHGRAGGCRNRRPDAPGKPDADAESGEGDSAYTAEHSTRYNDLTQGAGFLNARGAVHLAKLFASGDSVPADSSGIDPTPWNRTSTGATIVSAAACSSPDANAWRPDVTWGAARPTRAKHRLGHACGEMTAAQRFEASNSDEDNIVWGTSCANAHAATSCGVQARKTTSSGARRCGGDDCSSSVWGTECARRTMRQRRVGRLSERRQHRLGHASAPTTRTTSCGERSMKPPTRVGRKGRPALRYIGHCFASPPIRDAA